MTIGDDVQTGDTILATGEMLHGVASPDPRDTQQDAVEILLHAAMYVSRRLDSATSIHDVARMDAYARSLGILNGAYGRVAEL